MKLKRLFSHLIMPRWWVLRHFDGKVLAAVEQAVIRSEGSHRGELRFVVEGALPMGDLLRATTARERATDLFAQLRVWDTEANSGILIYVQLADRKVEILADRGITACVPQVVWDDICRTMESAYSRGEFLAGSLAAIDRAGQLLIQHFPAAALNPNELPDRPVVI